MRVQTEEWRRFIPGVQKTLFYNGEKLWEGEDDGNPLIYDWAERDLWEVVIVLPGVEVIPEDIFLDCRNVKTVIMADSVRRIEEQAFKGCRSLEFVRLSRTWDTLERMHSLPVNR